jgi:hypothetical protein
MAEYRAHARLSDVRGPEGSERQLFIGVQEGYGWPFLALLVRYDPAASMAPGILVIPETGVIFIGAGPQLMAYELAGPKRLWEDEAEYGFQDWQRHGDVVVVKAECGIAAWDVAGRKLWSTWSEPPWDYSVEGETVHLDVMGVKSSFPLRTGPL